MLTTDWVKIEAGSATFRALSVSLGETHQLFRATPHGHLSS